MASEGQKDLRLEDVQQPLICIVKDKEIEQMARADFVIGCLEKGYELVALEREKSHGVNLRDYCAVEILMTQNRRSYIFLSSNQTFTQSRILMFNKNASVRSIKKKIFKFLRPIIQAPDISEKVKQTGNTTEENILELEYRHFFENAEILSQYFDDDVQNPLYKV